MTAGDWDWFEALNEWRDHDHRLLFVQSPFRHLTVNALVAQVPVPWNMLLLERLTEAYKSPP